MSLAEHLLTEYQLKIKELTLIPSVGGVFDVKVDGELVYTNSRTGLLPTNEAIDAAINERLGG